MFETSADDSHEFAQRVQAHADDLVRNGIGIPPLMLRKSIFELLKGSPQLPELYATDAADFSALADRLAPPKLMAEHTHRLCKQYGLVILVPPTALFEVFSTLEGLTSAEENGKSDADREKSGQFRFSLPEMKDYLTFCSREPDLLLSSIYAIGVHQAFIHSVARMTKEPDGSPITDTMKGLAKHFNSTNFVNRLPIALRIAQVRSQGTDATLADMDTETMERAMQFIHDTGQFEITGQRTDGSSGLARLRCPMAGYLQRLLVTYDGFMPVIASTQKLTAISVEPSEASAQLLHHQNRHSLKAIADSMLRK